MIEDAAPRAGGRPTGRLALLGFTFAVLVGLAAMASGLGYRWGWWELGAAFTLLKWAAYGGVAAVAVSLLGVIETRAGPRRGGLFLALLGILVGALTAYVPWQWRQRAERVPPIHDITTDTGNPPEFEAVLPLRADAPNPPAYGGDSIAQLQREAYPEIEPLVLEAPPEAAFEWALEAARGMGWEIHAVEPEEGRIEATDTTFWFGFRDDVVVRVGPADGGSRIDVRSVSRVGRSDVGTNAERIRKYLDAVRASG